MGPIPKDKLVFLDIDGVLNSLRTVYAVKEGVREYMDPVAVQMLRTLICYTGAELVISSSWRIIRELEAIRQCLIRAGWHDCPVLEYKTPSVKNGFRGEEIALFLDWYSVEKSPVFSYVIFDDSSDFYTPEAESGDFRAKIEHFRAEQKSLVFREKQPLIQTDDAYGLCASHVKIARYMLNTLPLQPSGDKKIVKEIKYLRDQEGQQYKSLYCPLSF